MNAKKHWSIALSGLLVALAACGFAGFAWASEPEGQTRGATLESPASQVFQTAMAPWNYAELAKQEGALQGFDDAYRVRYDGAKVQVTNGRYQQNVPANVADDTDGFWEPGNNDTSKGPISITVTFDEPQTFQWVVYGSRLDAGLKGFATEFELAVSQSDAGEGDWATVTHGTGAATSSLCAFDACPEENELTARRVRFTFLASKENYPSCRALRFYKRDPNEHVLDGLWANYNHTQLAEGVRASEVEAKIEALASSPSYDAIYPAFYEPEVERVKAAEAGMLATDAKLEISNEANVDAGERSTRALTRVGDVAGYARNTLKFSNGATNRQVTGVWYPAGTVARIWVERANPEDPLPIVRWAQPYGYWASWQGGATQLVEGLNLITVPNYKTIDYKTYDIVAGCAAYLENPYTEEQQKGLVKVYFEGGRTFPVYRLGDDIDTYMAELRSHADRVRADHTAEMDVTELVSGHVMMTVQATRADEIYGLRGHDAKQALECWDTTIHRCLGFEGIVFDEDAPHYDVRNRYLNENFRVSQVWDLGWMFTAGEHIGVYTGDAAQDVLIDPLDAYGQSRIAPNWGLIHEWGHSIDIPARTIQETTNNMPAYYESTYCPEFERNGPDIERAHQMADPAYVSGTKFNENRYNFMPFWLVESYWPGWWGKVENLYRYEPQTPANGYGTDGKDLLNKTERMVLYASEAAGYDLRYWYERWGLNMDEANPRFVAATASPAFQALFSQKLADGTIRQTVEGFGEGAVELPLWFLDRGEYGAVTGASSREALTIYDEGVRPTIRTVQETPVAGEAEGVLRSVAIEQSDDPMHLVYLVERHEVGSEAPWEYVGYTYGGLFTDTSELPSGAALEYRVQALDRSLHASGYSEPVRAAELAVVATVDGEEYTSLAEAFASAPSGSTIELVESCYGENINVEGTYTLKPAAGSRVCLSRLDVNPIFDLAQNAALTIEGTADDGGTLVFDGLKVQGTAPGIRVAAAATLNASNVTFRNFTNAADGNAGQGGVINASVAAAHINLDDCTFTGNRALDGGAIAGRCTVALRRCTFTGNTARDEGGAIRNYSGGVFTLEGCDFTGNNGVYGGALSLEGFTNVRGCSITANTAKYGGGIDARLGGRPMVVDDLEGTRTIVEGNTALAGDALYVSNGQGTTVYLGDADLRASEAERHAVQVDQGHVVLNAELGDCVDAVKRNAPAFGATDGVAIEGAIAEMGSAKVTVCHHWLEGPAQIVLGEPGRALPVVGISGFGGEGYESAVQLASTGSSATLALTLEDGASGETDPGVYVQRGGRVILEANGGTVNAGAVEGYVAGARTFLPTNVSKTGYSFVGWFDNAELKGASVKCVEPDATGDRTFWAKWSQGNYWINYRPNGGKLPAGYQDHRSLEETVKLVEPTREGFTFLGWHEKSDFSDDPTNVILAGTHEGATTLYAQWTHGRNKGEVVEEVKPTCTTAGYRVVAYACVDCKEPMGAEREELPATGHSFGAWTKASANACQGSNVRSRTCKTCGFVEYDGLDDAAGHAWGDWTTVPGKDATCTTEGLEMRTCGACGVEEYRTTRALGHTFAEDDGATGITVAGVDEGDGGEGDPMVREVPATCENDGIREIYGECTRCGERAMREIQTIPATDHSYGEWSVVREADCELQSGEIREHTCALCGETRAELLPFEHAWESAPRVDVPATCTSEGTESIHCARCGARASVQPIAKTPHEYVDGVCTFCGAAEPTTSTQPQTGDVPGDAPGGSASGDTGTDGRAPGVGPGSGEDSVAEQTGGSPASGAPSAGTGGGEDSGTHASGGTPASGDGGTNAVAGSGNAQRGSSSSQGPNASEVPLADSWELASPENPPVKRGASSSGGDQPHEAAGLSVSAPVDEASSRASATPWGLVIGLGAICAACLAGAVALGLGLKRNE